MATYTFKCLCGLRLEENRKFGDNVPPPCPCCDHKMHQVIDGNPFILKGKGWYKPGHFPVK